MRRCLAVLGASMLHGGVAWSCEDLADHMDEAWTFFDDAELAQCDAVLAEALDELSCQSRLIDTQELLDFYELDGLVALANGDEDGAVRAVIRMATVDPTQPPAPSSGPRLAALYASWQPRVSRAQLEVTPMDGLEVVIDGRPTELDGPTTILAGEHLVQYVVEGAVRSEVLEILDSALLSLDADGLLTTLPLPEVAPPSEQPRLPRRPRGSGKAPGTPALWGTGLGLAALGGGAIAAGFVLEGRFKADPYEAASYGGCTRDQTCWASQRQEVIERDALLIRLAYGGGYGLVGAGAILTGVGFAVSPTPGGASAAVHVPLGHARARARRRALPLGSPRE